MFCKCGCGNITPIAKRNRKELGHIKNMHIDYLLGHKMRGVKGMLHYNFKGNHVGYKAFHLRVNQIRGKATICEDCGSNKFVEWANLTGHYEDIFDYKALCRKCHHKLDNIAIKTANAKRQKYNLSELAIKGWVTRRKTAYAAGIALQHAEGGGLRE